MEQWLSVVGYEGLYEVSDHGRVRSLPRQGTRGGLLAASPNPGGYLTVRLYVAGSWRTHKVHALVARAFIGPRPDGLEVRHLDGEQLNCRATNLSYGTHSDNMRDKVRHGTHHNASKIKCKSGHSLTDPANLAPRKGRRKCRECARLGAVEYRRRRAEQTAS